MSKLSLYLCGLCFSLIALISCTFVLPNLVRASETTPSELNDVATATLNGPAPEVITLTEVLTESNPQTQVASGWTFTQIIAVVVFALGYVLITLEHKLNMNKAAVSLAVGGILWILASTGLSHDALEHAMHNIGAEIFEIVAFLLSAMTLVEILIHYKLFDVIRVKLMELKFDDKKQFLVIAVLTFFLSAALDNLTITIVMAQIARRFFKGKNLLVVAAGIIILANAGGAWSPIGDVTTIMLWLADKFSATEVITQTIIPSLALGITATALLYRQIAADTQDIKEEVIKLDWEEKIIIGLGLGSFSLPFIMHMIGLRPYLGLVLGLGLVWLIIEFFRTRTRKETHLEAEIEKMLQKTDIVSLKFFIGILLAVSALQSLGVLEHLSSLLFGSEHTFEKVMVGNVVLGLLSAVVDNVPLTALAIDLIHTTDVHLWTLLALTVGTGGSALIVGSVAGVVMMGIIKELTFDKYLKIAFVPAVVSYLVGVAVWYGQYILVLQ